MCPRCSLPTGRAGLALCKSIRMKGGKVSSSSSSPPNCQLAHPFLLPPKVYFLCLRGAAETGWGGKNGGGSQISSLQRDLSLPSPLHVHVQRREERSLKDGTGPLLSLSLSPGFNSGREKEGNGGPPDEFLERRGEDISQIR